ncbi:MAG: carboxylesterase/lipase family protein [Promethearchaeota archaeon]|jgi:para-nitrobenzyl esterase
MKKTDIVETITGKLRGSLENGLHVFKGIPYAQPPIGDLRFKDTVQKEPWDGVLEATEFGFIPSQPYIPASSIKDHPQSEDCLTLNIWTPRCDKEKRPVMFWIHGGAFYYGGAPSLRYNGEFLSKRGNIVVITINYRLGALGNLYVPGKVSNLGFMDQFTALKWVSENISNFGGDPKNITIFGESAGSTSVCTLLSMPIAKELIRRAICQSGALNPQRHHPEGGTFASKKLFSKLGIKMGDIDSLRKVSADKLIEVESEIRMENMIKREVNGYPPIIDGEKVPEHPIQAINKGASKEIDLLIGTNLNEWAFFSILNPELEHISWNELTEYIKISLKEFDLKETHVEKFISSFTHSEDKPIDVLNAISTELVFRFPSRRVAEEQSKHNNNTYMYLFTYRTPTLGGNLGAPHALEIPFVFGTLDDIEFGVYPKRDEINTKISELVMDSWISFARSGNPNHDGIPHWPKYEREKRFTILIGEEIRIKEDPLRPERLAMEEITQK